MPDDIRTAPPESDTLVPGLDISIIVGCGGERQVSLRTMIRQDTPLDQCHALVDKAFAIGDRQKARYDLEKEEHELDQVGIALTALIAGLPLAERSYLETVGKLKAELAKTSETYQQLHDEGYQAWVKSGRSTEYKPDGARKANMQRQLDAGKKISEEIERQRVEAEQGLKNTLISIEKYRRDVRLRIEKVNGMRAIVGLLPVAPFEDALTCKLPEVSEG